MVLKNVTDKEVSIKWNDVEYVVKPGKTIKADEEGAWKRLVDSGCKIVEEDGVAKDPSVQAIVRTVYNETDKEIEVMWDGTPYLVVPGGELGVVSEEAHKRLVEAGCVAEKNKEEVISEPETPIEQEKSIKKGKKKII